MRKILGLLTVLLSGCAGHSAVVLLPEADGKVGALEITSKTAQQAQALTTAYQTTAVATPDSTPRLATTTPEAVQATYGEALKAQPAPPAKFVLNFEAGGAQLTPESTQLLPQIIGAINERRSTDISAVGHADRVGDAEKNRQISAERAEQIAQWLVQQGVARINLEVTSHGEANPLIPTADEVAEPRNRRVEITVR